MKLRALTIWLLLLTVFPTAASAELKLNVSLRIDPDLRIGEAPKLMPWPDGLPRALQIQRASAIEDETGSALSLGPGVFLPQELAAEYYSRMITLEQYPQLAQVVIDQTSKAVYEEMRKEIDDRAYTFWDLVRTSILVGAVSLIVGGSAVIIAF